MTTKTTKTDEPSVRLPWRSRAQFVRGRTRKQRQDQYRAQINFLAIIVGITVVVAGIFIYANWLQSGSTKTASCADYPQYCVPHAAARPAATSWRSLRRRQPHGWMAKARQRPASCAA